ncbi:hypothetical protein [uncultured Desulfobulbus sp.]|uniref:hypothetical protein n=1 Tax=uncultured Desulfobulbus sp. TaxID=239745 RepID=UPI0029C8E076|nr:hypothetical protein [uncultured Desulfobulbus sp.]
MTSLSPLIGAGYACAFIQVMSSPLMVKEFEVVSKDIVPFKGWWHNKLLRIFLVFLLTTVGYTAWVHGSAAIEFSTLSSTKHKQQEPLSLLSQ